MGFCGMDYRCVYVYAFLLDVQNSLCSSTQVSQSQAVFMFVYMLLLFYNNFIVFQLIKHSCRHIW